MDAVTLRRYETLGPFEIKNDLAKVATKTAKSLTGRLPERRTRQSELDRDRAAIGVLPARPVRGHRKPAHDAAGCRHRRNGEGSRHRRSTRVVARAARRHAGRRAPPTGRPLGGEDVRFQRRTPSCTSWSTRSSATTIQYPIECSCTTSESSASTCSGRCAASPGRPARSASTRSRAAPRRCATSSSRSRRTGCSIPATPSPW